MSELRHALDSLFRKPAFTLTALLTIVLGVGANTAVYTVVHAVLIQPLPFRDPAALIQAWETHPDFHNLQVAVPDYVDWKKSVPGVDFAAYTFEAINKATLLGQGDPLQVQATNASADLFPLFGIRQLLGHPYTAQQEHEKERVALISERLWRKKFSNDASILGRPLRLDTDSFTVVGVVRQEQAFPTWADVWIPLSLIDADTQSTRKYHPLEVVGRLRAGVSLAQAESQVEAVAQRLSRSYAATNGKIGAFVVPLLDAVTGEARPALMAVWIAVGLVLLIACTNLAHLMLAWSLNARRDIAVRLALGASRIAALRSFFIESLVLSLGGGLLGLLAATAALPVLRNLAQGRIPRLDTVAVNGPVLLFGLLLSCLVALLFSLPAFWQVARTNLNEAFGSGEMRSFSSRRSWASSLLMGTEVGLSLAVLIAATMLVRSFALTLNTDPGFRRGGSLAANIPVGPGDPNQCYPAFVNRILPEVKKIPGVQDVAAINSVPMTLGVTEHSRFATRFGIVGRTFEAGQFPTAQIRWGTANYLSLLSVPLIYGRYLSDKDLNQPRYVINEAFRQHFFPEKNGVGERLLLGVVAPHPQVVEIVGVVGDVRDFGLDREPEPTMYTVGFSPRMDLLVHASGNLLAIPPFLSAALHRAEPEGAVGRVRTLEGYIDDSLTRQRFAMFLMTVFAGLALVLCVIGIYGVFGYSVTRRLREFGIRFALGAARQNVTMLILRDCLGVVIPGLVFGVLISLQCSQFLSALLYRISPTDTLSYVIAASFILMVCLASAVVPAIRASKVDPVNVLREE